MVLGHMILDHVRSMTTAFDSVDPHTIALEPHHMAEPLEAASAFLSARIHGSSRAFQEVTSFFPTDLTSSAMTKPTSFASSFLAHPASFESEGRGEPPDEYEEGPNEADLANQATGQRSFCYASVLGPRYPAVNGGCPRGDPRGPPDELIKYAINSFDKQAICTDDKCGNVDLASVRKTVKQAEDAIAYTRMKMKGWTNGAGDEVLKALAQAQGKKEGAAPLPTPPAQEGRNQQMGGSGTFLDAEVPAAAAGSQLPHPPMAEPR